MSPEAAVASGGAAGLRPQRFHVEKALDVSAYQGRVGWSDVHAAGYRHAFVKATEGETIVDAEAKRNVHGCRRHGISVALYHFAHPSESPLRNARHFLSVAGELVRVGDPAPVLDLEVSEGLAYYELRSWAGEWFRMVEERFGCRAVLYSYLDFLAHYRPERGRPVWGACYGSVPARLYKQWHAWQYSSSGRVRGIGGAVDLDRILKPLPVVRRTR